MMSEYISIEMMNENVYYFTFKYAYTCKTITLHFVPNITMSEFITEVKTKVCDENIEIVRAGQYINGIYAEKAPPVVSSNNTLKKTYGANWKNVAFYIRKSV